MRFELRNERTGEVVARDAYRAGNPLSRMRGLLGRSSLPAGEAIILEPAASIHTFFMRFGIDVLFLDRSGAVVKVVKDLRPWRLASAKGARSVIEMAAGSTDGLDLQPGDRIVREPWKGEKRRAGSDGRGTT
jgi:uncharacterized membrane protein (UPF0127 family)